MRKVHQKRIVVSLLLAAGVLMASAGLAVTVVVTDSADTVTGCSTAGTGGGCTLRDAITFSNANPQPPGLSNLIEFNIPGAGVHTIGLNSPLPPITTALVIDGYSQPGASPNTLPVGNDAVLLVSLQVSNLHAFPQFQFMLSVSGGSGSVIRGMVIEGATEINGLTNFNAAPINLGSCCNRIVGNFLGVDPGGNAGGLGDIYVNSSTNQIGTSSPADRNVIDGYLELQSGERNTIEGNYIGTNASGTAGLGAAGVSVSSSNNVIGPDNVISGGDGIVISGAFPPDFLAKGNLIAGNLIGTDATGTRPVPNAEYGITLAQAQGNIIGAFGVHSFKFFGNRIAFNTAGGVLVFPGYVGSRANRIRSNSIFSNGGLGIDLSNTVDFRFEPPITDGVTPNDACDDDSGPNELQNYPTLTSAIAFNSKTAIQGTLNSKPNTTYAIQLFANQACDPSGFGQGETFLDEVFVTTDGNCEGSFTASVPVADAPAGRFITATATDPLGNTSEFSACLQVTALLIPTQIRLVEGPIRVAPGVPVQLRFKVGSREPGPAGDLSGVVIISDDQGDFCRADVSPSGEGACPLTFGAPGNYRVRARYLGNPTFQESTSPAVPVLVGMPGGSP